MTKVCYVCTDDHVSLVLNGHAGYAEHGKDIVCAGISALCGALEIALEKLQETGAAVSCLCKAGDGFFSAEARGVQLNGGTKTAFDLVYGGLCRIEEAYPQYISCRRSYQREEEKA